MKLVYLGTPEAAVAPLRALHDAGHEIVLVVSNPDRRRGRGTATSPSPVKAAALELGLPVTDDLDAVRSAGADLGVVVAYGRIIGTDLLAELPMVNLHFSLLPRWRGAAPVERAILAGDEVTGVCVMAVDEGLDTGAVFARREIAIGPSSTAAELRAELVEVGAALLVETLSIGLGEPEPQADDGVTYAAKLTAEDRRLDWTLPAADLHRVVRVGGAWTTFRGGRFKVHEAELREGVDAALPGEPGTVHAGPAITCGDGALRLVRVQPEGRAAMDAGDWVNGSRPLGDVLGS